MIFTNYTMQPGLISGRNIYRSDDGSVEIYYCGIKWNIDVEDKRFDVTIFRRSTSYNNV